MKLQLKLRVIIMAAAVFLPLSAYASENVHLLEQAEEAFRLGNDLLQTDPAAAQTAYLDSVKYYNSLIESGVRNAALYYNTANAYVRLEQTGKAVLNYRRALIYDPNDNQIRSNLEYARGLQKNGFEVKTENEILHIVFFWHYLMPPGVKAGVLILANMIFWGTLILSRFGRRMPRAAVAAAVMIAAFSASLLIDIRNTEIQHGVITAESTIGRLGDSRSYESAFDTPLYEGVEFTIKQKRVGWLLAELPNGEVVWIEEKDCGIVEAFD